MNETFFSKIEFISAVAKSFKGRQKCILPITVVGSGPKREMYAIRNRDRHGRYLVSLAPFGLYASPGWENKLEYSTVRSILKQIRRFGTVSFSWTVRFDHTDLAESLISSGLKYVQYPTHILDLGPGYERVLASFSSTIRRHIRISKREGVEIVRVFDESSIRDYHAIYMKLAEQQKRKFSYPIELFLELAKESASTFFLMAIKGDKIIGGGVFFYDGCSMRYWHGASDREFDKSYPSCALLDYAIRQGCEARKSFFGFGGSAGKVSLEQFKSYWGAERKLYWEFKWQNPIWVFARSVQSRLAKLVHLKGR